MENKLESDAALDYIGFQDAMKTVREFVDRGLLQGREKSIVITKLDEAELWYKRGYEVIK